MKADLRDVSLIIVDTRCHQLAKMAVEDCIERADFGEVLIFSDKDLNVPGALEIPTEDAPSKLEWSKFLWYKVPDYVRTTTSLLIQWDSWIVDPTRWRPEFLSYDYIGAPWLQYPNGMNVGNSGFSLRSKRLMNNLIRFKEHFPVSDPEDDALSRRHRMGLEAIGGFRWAPFDTALDFSFECLKGPDTKHFGFHAMRNWPIVLDRERLIDRVKIAMNSDFIKAGDHINQTFAVAPWLRETV